MKTKKLKLTRVAACMLIGASLLSGCAATVKQPQERIAEVKLIKRAVLVTKGMKIEVLDADGSMPQWITPDEMFLPGRHVPAMHPPFFLQHDSDHFKAYYGERGYYGITDISDMALGYNNFAGLIRRVIPGSPAAEKGWGQNDVFIKSLNGKVPSFDYEIDLGSWRTSYVVCRDTAAIAGGIAGMFAGSQGCDSGVLEAARAPQPYRVKIHVEGREKPLIGLLAFFPVLSTAEGAASRIYRIEVPDRYIERARAGNVSVVYQPYKADTKDAISGRVTQDEKVSWALWMSDLPFYD